MLAVTAVLLAACPSPGGNPPPEVALTFEQAAVRKSKMLISTNGDAVQSFTNTLLNNGTPVTTGAAYSITAKPDGLTTQITVNPSTGKVTFGAAALAKVNRDGPQTVTVQAAHQGKTASYTFTLTDHFSGRMNHSSVVLGDDEDIYVIGGAVQISTPTDANDVWRSSDGGLTWDQVDAEGKRFTPRRSTHNSIVLGNDIYVIAGYSFDAAILSYPGDVWKSADRGVSWGRTANYLGGQFPRGYASAQVLKNAIYLMGGHDGLAYRNSVWKSANGGRTWREATQPSTPKFTARQSHSSVVLGEGDAAELYVIGGQGSGTPSRFNDVWKSADGRTWSEVAGGTPFTPPRNSHTLALVKDGSHAGLYLIAGEGAASNLKDVWKSTDQGKNWTRVTDNAPFGIRTGHTSVVRGTTMYVIGGTNDDGTTTLHNDVWKSDDGGATWVNVHANP